VKLGSKVLYSEEDLDLWEGSLPRLSSTSFRWDPGPLGPSDVESAS
jgi:hypothetical protein